MTAARVAGHTLAFEGAPYQENGTRVWRPYGGTSGVGCAKCSCKVLSPVLPSGNARRTWHKAHKLAVETGRSASGVH